MPWLNCSHRRSVSHPSAVGRNWKKHHSRTESCEDLCAEETALCVSQDLNTARAVAFYVVPTRKTTNEIFHMTFTSCVHQTMAVSTSIAPATGSFLDRQQGRTGTKA
eukprot:scaffold55554_cov58-Attheya_sp.AAC.1